MKDIDFDELDRAVSSVLGQKTAGTGIKPDKVEKNEPPTPTEDAVVDTTPVVETDSSVAEPVTSKPATTPLAIKRRGKFMDVMHPSAGMKPVGAASAKTPRPAPVITPLLTEEAESTVEHTAEPTASLDESHTLIGAEPAPISNTLPDSGEAAESADTPAESLSSDTSAESQSSEQTNDDNLSDIDEQTETQSDEVFATERNDDVEAESQSPQTTPFLSDTQVEKRPLGAFGDTETAQDSSDGDESVAEQPAAMQAAPAMSLPRELQPDVVEVESVQATETLEAPIATSANPFAAKVAVAPEASDGRVEGHPLFDTSTYHEPIAAVSHGAMPGWAKWLIGLLACLAVGAGVGYFLFTAGL